MGKPVVQFPIVDALVREVDIRGIFRYTNWFVKKKKRFKWYIPLTFSSLTKSSLHSSSLSNWTFMLCSPYPALPLVTSCLPFLPSLGFVCIYLSTLLAIAPTISISFLLLNLHNQLFLPFCSTTYYVIWIQHTTYKFSLVSFWSFLNYYNCILFNYFIKQLSCCPCIGCFWESRCQTTDNTSLQTGAITWCFWDFKNWCWRSYKSYDSLQWGISDLMKKPNICQTVVSNMHKGFFLDLTPTSCN